MKKIIFTIVAIMVLCSANFSESVSAYEEKADTEIRLDDVLLVLNEALGIENVPQEYRERLCLFGDEVANLDDVMDMLQIALGIECEIETDYVAISKSVISTVQASNKENGYIAVIKVEILTDSQIEELIQQLNNNDEGKVYRYTTRQKMIEEGVITNNGCEGYEILTGTVVGIGDVKKTGKVITITAWNDDGFLDGDIYQVKFKFENNEWKMVKNEIIGFS